MRRCLFFVLATFVFGAQAFGQGVGVINQEVPDFTDASTYLLNDAVFSAATNVDSYTMYFTNINGVWGNFTNTDARFNLFPNDGVLDTEDPLAGTEMAADFSLNVAQNVVEVTVSGLGLNLGPGSYWFGLTPIVASTLPQEFSTSTANVNTGGNVLGNESAFINPSGFLQLGPDWQPAANAVDTNVDGFDFAFTLRDIDGNIVWDQQPNQPVPEPASASLIALVCVTMAARRRRS